MARQGSAHNPWSPHHLTALGNRETGCRVQAVSGGACGTGLLRPQPSVPGPHCRSVLWPADKPGLPFSPFTTSSSPGPAWPRTRTLPSQQDKWPPLPYNSPSRQTDPESGCCLAIWCLQPLHSHASIFRYVKRVKAPLTHLSGLRDSGLGGWE